MLLSFLALFTLVVSVLCMVELLCALLAGLLAGCDVVGCAGL